MDIILRVTASQLISMSNDIKAQIGEIEKQFAQIEIDISQSQAYWEGDASDLHKKKYDDLKEHITGTIQNLKRHPDNLLQMANIYTASEDMAKQRTQALQTDFLI